jgi:hypothetical protein
LRNRENVEKQMTNDEEEKGEGGPAGYDSSSSFCHLSFHHLS